MSCGFAWNGAFDVDLLDYDASYENNQSLSPAFERHLTAVADAISSTVGGKDGVVAVEVGCGQGYFLHRLQAMFGDRVSALIGFDPAYRVESPLPAGARVEQDYFDLETCGRLGVEPDLVVTRHVIEHVNDPVAFLKTIRAVCAVGTPLFVETPTIQWILDGAVAHDLYYEHCSIFDAESLRLALELAGFEVEEVRPMLDGQYIFAIARAADAVTPRVRSLEPHNKDYPPRRQSYVDHWRSTFEKDRADGETVALWGGASKGVTLALLLGDALKSVSMAIDINPARQGGFMPVTALPVASPEDARSAGVTKAYVMNPAYLPEIRQFCEESGWPIKLEAVA